MAKGMKLESVETWSAHPNTAPKTARRRGGYAIAANGTRTCSGGWEFVYSGVRPGQAYRVRTEVRSRDIAHPRDVLLGLLYWDRPPRNQVVGQSIWWHYLLPVSGGRDRMVLERTLRAPAGARRLAVRYVFRWAARGGSSWAPPDITPVTLAPPKPVTVCAVTGRQGGRPKGPLTIRDNIAYYGALCRAACRRGRPDLILLPEIALDWGVAGSPLDHAVPAPGPETGVFAALARKHRCRILLGMHERAGDAVFNSLVFIGPTGKIDGKYHKVHLASSESFSGVQPGDGFPVFETELGRIGGNICMDSSCAESSRMVGLNGADFLCLAIMGDHRADRFSVGAPIYCADRWKAIQRTHALDNQLCLAIARNQAKGSCVIDRKGDILAWNEGDSEFVQATVELDDGYRSWNGGCFRDVNWMQRRPHLYGAAVDEFNVGSLR
ncbi:MAG: carbon-nitrogen hydrolase family protein [Kiritimatiellae bacterium]|nr:carbon-nitrogen hydrolase family protein [Kiritimatiellia bacterium]